MKADYYYSFPPFFPFRFWKAPAEHWVFSGKHSSWHWWIKCQFAIAPLPPVRLKMRFMTMWDYAVRENLNFNLLLSISCPFLPQMPWCVDISVLCRTTQKQPLPYSGSIHWEPGHCRCHHNLATTWLKATYLLQASVFCFVFFWNEELQWH